MGVDLAHHARRASHEVGERAMANELDNFELAMMTKVEGLTIDRMEQNQENVTRCPHDPTFQTAAFKSLISGLYKEIRRDAAHAPSSR